MLRFDIAEIYDEAGNLKHIHSIPKKARLMISELSSDELKGTVKGKTVAVGQTKKVKVFDKLQAIEKLMKHFGGYKADNDQSKPEIHINWNEQKTYETPKEDEEIEK